VRKVRQARAVYLGQIAMKESVPDIVSLFPSGVSAESEVAKVSFSSKTLAQEGMIWES